MQKLWQLKLNWDELIPAELHTAWKNFYVHLNSLNNVSVPRHVLTNDYKQVELHGFCDASELAYGACIYLRSSNSDGLNECKLLCAKSKVAPLKTISLPRLELCGAVLLSKLVRKVLEALQLVIGRIYLWCDSSIVLCWLAGEPSNWKTFVANRVAQVQCLTNVNDWNHISSKDNSADVISRGIRPDKLQNCNLWWFGPPWLAKDKKYWPESVSEGVNPPEKRIKTAVLNVSIGNSIFTRYSSLSKLKSVTAYCIRFIKNCKVTKEQRCTGSLTGAELKKAMIVLVKEAQAVEFAYDLKCLSVVGAVKPSSRLVSLSPFLDENKIIRVGGRLKNSHLNHDAMHQMLLPANNQLTKLIIMYEHKRNMHAGIQGTLAAIRQQYWIINGTSAVKGMLNKCITCIKAKPTLQTPQMGQLPAARVNFCRPFYNCGVDYAGPLFVKDGKLRNRQIIKCYLVVFVCLSTKAIHLELAGDLSTASFLDALKRFVSRRGLPKVVNSDNGTNFVGAKNELKHVKNALAAIKVCPEISFHFKNNNIEWKFIPPESPQFGGIWEAGVKSAKFHMKRVLGSANLTFENLYTIITQIEAILNSRPLIPLTSDANDLQALTPGHFLIGEPLTAVPQLDVTAEKPNKLKQYLRQQQLLQHFWQRWSREYLTSLQNRRKWQQNLSNVGVGDLVVIKDDRLPALYWKMGRIIKLHPGNDGIIRVVTIKTAQGEFQRPVRKVCVLPVGTRP